MALHAINRYARLADSPHLAPVCPFVLLLCFLTIPLYVGLFREPYALHSRGRLHLLAEAHPPRQDLAVPPRHGLSRVDVESHRSEERRVGKEWTLRCWR